MNDIDPQLLPDADAVARYHELGWYVSPPLFDDEELDRAIDASERYYAGLDEQQIDLPNGRSYRLAWYQGTGADKLRKNDYTTPIVPELDALLRKPALGLTGALLAGEDVRLWLRSSWGGWAREPPAWFSEPTIGPVCPTEEIHPSGPTTRT